MATATIDILATLLGVLGDAKPAWRVSSSAPVGKADKVDLASGANTITIPSGTSMVVFEPPATNTTAWTVKGVSGDTGWAADPDSPQFLSPAASVTSLVITTGGAISGFRIWFI